MDVLENIVIGNFIFGLGWEMRNRGLTTKPEPVSVNLLQQGPMDTTMGDLLIANARVVRLIEFKREMNKDKKEGLKLRMLVNVLATPSLRHLEPLSRKIHWFVLTNYNRAERSSVVVPYLDQQQPSGDRDLAQFQREIAEEVVGPGMTDEQLKDVQLYLEALGRFAGSKQVGAGTAGGLLFTTDARGQVNYLLIENVRELAMEPRAVIARHAARHRLVESERIALAQGQEVEKQRLKLEQSQSFGLRM